MRRALYWSSIAVLAVWVFVAWTFYRSGPVGVATEAEGAQLRGAPMNTYPALLSVSVQSAPVSTYENMSDTYPGVLSVSVQSAPVSTYPPLSAASYALEREPNEADDTLLEYSAGRPEKRGDLVGHGTGEKSGDWVRAGRRRVRTYGGGLEPPHGWRSFTERQWEAAMREEAVDKNEAEEVPPIVFIKTHKTGSTTMNAVFARIALQYGMFPIVSKFLGNPSNGFRVPESVTMSSCGRFDMINSHTPFSPQPQLHLVPCASFVTILRDPITAVQSAFYYYRNAAKHLPRSPSGFAQFASDPERHDPDSKFRNSMCFDLGRSPHTNTPSVREVVAQLVQYDAFVVMNEHWHESMALLRRKLGLRMSDVLHLRVMPKGGSKKVDKSAYLQRGSAEADALLPHLSCIEPLYQFWNNTLWAMFRAHGEAIEYEAELIRRATAQFQSACAALHGTPNGVSSRIFGLNITGTVCASFQKKLADQKQHYSNMRSKGMDARACTRNLTNANCASKWPELHRDWLPP
eukprot:TRINITY_DN7378_c0_g1_i1.p1 TRINITY_DN7378_c0_g1~~TRINITY_DN7378_c0_g1_i1.p1  ORF type:complete len:518 (-),score=129.18 TRINITY_DN7378_c0_g1_i1:841-2394(-)